MNAILLVLSMGVLFVYLIIGKGNEIFLRWWIITVTGAFFLSYIKEKLEDKDSPFLCLFESDITDLIAGILAIPVLILMAYFVISHIQSGNWQF